MSSKDEFGIDLSCITRYIDDLAKIPSNVRKKAIRSSLKRGNRLLLQSERERLGKLAQSEGKLNQYGTPHSGFLRKGIKGRIKVRNDRVALIVGVRNMDKNRITFVAGRLHKIKAPTYAGIWLNYGTRSHSISSGSSMRKKIQGDSSVKGIAGTDWVMRSYNDVKDRLFQYIAEDLENTYNDNVKSKY